VGRVELPPLSKRSGDVTELAKHFWSELGGAPPGPPPDVLAQWERASWPGNVRQLRNAVARRIALGELGDDFKRDLEVAPSQRGATLSGEADIIAEVIAQQLPLPLARLRVIEAFEARYISAVLAAYDGNVALAAKASGIARRYFQILRSGKRRA
jgi:DNA-binding NtrC family response regulator